MSKRRRGVGFAMRLGMLGLLTGPGLAAELELDVSYGRGGFAVLAPSDVLSGGSYGYVPLPPAMRVLPDGSVLFAGGSSPGALRLLKVAPDGQMDAGFGRAGRVELPLSAATDGSTPGLAVTRRGQIVVAGGLAGGRVRVLRLNPDGTLDTRFGTDGFADRALPGADGPSRAVRLALDSQERIRVAASCDQVIQDAPRTCSPRSWRLLADGGSDPGFADAAIGLPGVNRSYPLSLEMLPDDSSVVLLEEPEDIMDNAERLVRILEDGRVDAAFTNARTWPQIASILAHEGALYVATPGRLLRLDARGALDESFADRGGLALDGSPLATGGAPRLVALAADGPGSLLGSGALITDTGWHPSTLFTRIGNQGPGGIDRSFGRDGFARVALGMAFFNGQALGRDPAGRVIVAGLTSSRVATGMPVVARLRLQVTTASESPGAIGFEDQGASINESSGSLRLEVLRTGGSRGAASVEYATVPGSATEGADFAATRGRLDWADGDDSSRTIVIRVLDDPDAEPSEVFALELRDPQGATLAGPTRMFITIQASDPAGGGSTAPAPPSVAVGDGSGGGGAIGAGWLLMALAALAGQRAPAAWRQPRLRP